MCNVERQNKERERKKKKKWRDWYKVENRVPADTWGKLYAISSRHDHTGKP